MISKKSFYNNIQFSTMKKFINSFNTWKIINNPYNTLLMKIGLMVLVQVTCGKSKKKMNKSKLVIFQTKIKMNNPFLMNF
jgi:hypothetical protein